MSEKIRVMSYNLRSGYGMNGKNYDLAGIVNVLRKYQPDITGLQEVRIHKDKGEAGNMVAVLAAETGMRSFFGQTLDQQYFTYGISALAKEGELAEVIQLPCRPTAEPRVAIVVKQQRGEKTFYLVNTHLSFEDDQQAERVDQIRAILDVIEAKGYKPAIFTGDWNARPSEPCVELLKSTWAFSDLTINTFPADEPRCKIDYIAWSPADAFEMEKYEVIDEKEASDHLPIMADLILRGGE